MSASDSVPENAAPPAPVSTPAPAAPSSETQTRLVDIPITSENVALNVLIGFLSVAQKRGTFLFDESGKINECIKVFMKPTVPDETSN
tara:strand:- start:462 stop:725 length:264 start_codon:yes stop_codon:yes gene_type:complete